MSLLEEEAMATSKEDIRTWLKRVQRKKSVTHVLIVCDRFDYSDYPVEVTKAENVVDKVREYDRMEMSQVMEVYSMKRDLEEQLNELRAWHLE